MFNNLMKKTTKKYTFSSPENQDIYFLPSVLYSSQEKQQRVLFFSKKHNQTASKSLGISQSCIIYENISFCTIHKTLDIYFVSISC